MQWSILYIWSMIQILKLSDGYMLTGCPTSYTLTWGATSYTYSLSNGDATSYTHSLGAPQAIRTHWVTGTPRVIHTYWGRHNNTPLRRHKLHTHRWRHKLRTHSRGATCMVTYSTIHFFITKQPYYQAKPLKTEFIFDLNMTQKKTLKVSETNSKTEVSSSLLHMRYIIIYLQYTAQSCSGHSCESRVTVIRHMCNSRVWQQCLV